jgi:hypothetical protein
MPEPPGLVASVELGVLGVDAPPGVVELEGCVALEVGATVGLGREGLVGVVVLPPMLRQPANKVAVRTRIRVMMLAFFIF